MPRLLFFVRHAWVLAIHDDKPAGRVRLSAVPLEPATLVAGDQEFGGRRASARPRIRSAQGSGSPQWRTDVPGSFQI